MSQSNAAAIRRRVAVEPNKPVQAQVPNRQQQQQHVNVNSAGLTLPQVISLVDQRLIVLESFMQESKDTNKTVKFEQVQMPQQQPQPENTVKIDDFATIIDEFNHRFELLADEINTMKDIVIKLQSFTMEVNKTLMNERIQILSELGHGENEQNQQEQSEGVTVVEVDVSDKTDESTENVKPEFI
jgi:hypothetical protein